MIVDSPDSLGARMRRRRWCQLERTFPEIGSMDVIDLGGTVEFWLNAPVRPSRVTLINSAKELSAAPEWVVNVPGDACDLPAEVSLRTYDLVYSNSVIEHVGGHARRQEFAAAVQKLASRHWVQTPYRYFPIEPHFLFPGAQFIPVKARGALIRRWPLNHTMPIESRTAMEAVLGIELLGRAEFAFYFPGSTILVERVGGFVKSLIAVGGSASRPVSE